MKIPNRCPACGDNYKFEYSKFQGKEYLHRSCSNKLNHKLWIFEDQEFNEILSITIQHNCFWFTWEQTKYLMVQLIPSKNNNNPESHLLPYFEPDFSNYPKLLEKLKTYLIFF